MIQKTLCFLLLVLLAAPFAAMASLYYTTVTTRIVSIHEKSDSDSDNKGARIVELFLENGMVAYMKNPDPVVEKSFVDSKESREYYDFLLKSKDFEITFYERSKMELPEEETPEVPFNDQKRNLQNVVSFEEAQQVFAKMHARFAGARRVIFRGVSQCFRRAEVWSYEMEMNNQLESRKYFLMFTGRFRGGGCSYHWWFHVTPYVFVSSNGAVAMTMDREYTRGPMFKDEWSRLFVNSKGGGCHVPTNVTCPVLGEFQYVKF
jgi:hypothetical protein